MSHPEITPPHENRQGRKVHLYTPDTLRRLDSLALPKFHAAVGLLRASLEELRDMNGVRTTDESLHEIAAKRTKNQRPPTR